MDYCRILLLLASLVLRQADTAQVSLSLWKRMMSVNSTQDFLQQFVRLNSGASGQQTAFDEKMQKLLFNAHGGLNPIGKDVAADLLAPSDHCVPRMTSLPLEMPSQDGVFHWPQSMMVQRCGGFCGHDALECVPTRVESAIYQVLKTRLQEDSDQLLYEGMDSVKVQRHLQCRCECKVQPQHCNSTIHTYDADACQCRCHNETGKCGPRMRWENDQCACACNITADQCESQEVFNGSTCSCDPVTTTTTQPTTTSMLTSTLKASADHPTTSTRPAHPPTKADPCLGKTCRPGYTLHHFGANACRCEFNMHALMAAHVPRRLQPGIPLLPHYLPPRYQPRRTYP